METIAPSHQLSFRQKLQPLLSDREELLWTGQPRQGLIFRGYDLFLVPFSVIWGLGMVGGFGAAMFSGAPPFFLIFFAFIAVVAFYLIAGRFLVDIYSRSKTYYGVTNRRVIIHNEGAGGKTQSFDLKTLSNLSLEQSKNGLGTVTVGVGSPRQAMMRGFNFPGYSHYMPPALEQIPDAQRVYELIQDARS